MTTKINFSVALAAITSPSWLPTIDSISAGIGPWIPILGLLLLVLQIIKLICDWPRKPKP